MTTAAVLDALETRYGPQQAEWPTEPYDFLIWWHCGYPASDAACHRGWEALTGATDIAPESLLKTPLPKLAAALAAGGMVPELRAQRLQQIAQRVLEECGGDLHLALGGPIDDARKLLKKFPNIAGPGVDRILLFAGINPVAAVPSNCPHVLVRIRLGSERENYVVTYREAQQLIEDEVASTFAARKRAFLLLKQHGQAICKRKPKCDACLLAATCCYAAGNDRGGARPR